MPFDPKTGERFPYPEDLLALQGGGTQLPVPLPGGGADNPFYGVSPSNDEQQLLAQLLLLQQLQNSNNQGVV